MAVTGFHNAVLENVSGGCCCFVDVFSGCCFFCFFLGFFFFLIACGLCVCVCVVVEFYWCLFVYLFGFVLGFVVVVVIFPIYTKPICFQNDESTQRLHLYHDINFAKPTDERQYCLCHSFCTFFSSGWSNILNNTLYTHNIL